MLWPDYLPRQSSAGDDVKTVLLTTCSYVAASGAGQLRRARGKPFLELAYGYMPLVWAGTLAHYLLPFFSEAGRLLPVMLFC